MRVHKDVLNQLEFPCTLCDQVFKKLNDLTRHRRKHPENKSHQCTICSKMFSQGSHLIDHLNRHNNLRPHVCHICNKGSVRDFVKFEFAHANFIFSIPTVIDSEGSFKDAFDWETFPVFRMWEVFQQPFESSAAFETTPEFKIFCVPPLPREILLQR